MLSYWESILLGTVQGVTEWLPISSSGHLVILQKLLGIGVPIFFDVLLHIGTLLVIFAFFWKDILSVLKAFSGLRFKTEYGKLGLLLILGSLPTAIIGLVFHDILSSFFENLFVVGIGMILNGTFLFFAEKNSKKRDLSWLDSVLIGIAQGIAIIPGISRSGFTIGMGLIRGIEKEKVVRFSFLLAIPVIIGATVLEKKSDLLLEMRWPVSLVGFFVSATVGFFSLKILVNMVKEKKLKWFSWYCWVVGTGIILMGIFTR